MLKYLYSTYNLPSEPRIFLGRYSKHIKKIAKLVKWDNPFYPIVGSSMNRYLKRIEEIRTSKFHLNYLQRISGKPC